MSDKGKIDALCDISFRKGVEEGRKEMRAALNECADDLESEIKGRFCDSRGDVHPALQNRFQRDLAPVRKARELIASQQEPAERKDG